MLFSTLSAYTSQTDFNVLSTLEAALSSSKLLREQLQEALSSVPIHPFEQLKAQYLQPDTEYLTLEQLSVDNNFDAETYSASICAISVKQHEAFMTQFSKTSALGLSSMNCNAFVELSVSQEDNSEQFVVNPVRCGKYLSMLETIKQIPIQAIERDPINTAKKLITYYINVMS